MLSNEPWITTQVAAARSKHPDVTDAASNSMTELLNGEMCERPLSATELAAAAAKLISGMEPLLAKEEAEQ
jgi:hypothetical protein